MSSSTEEGQEPTLQETMWAAQWQYAESTGIADRYPDSINSDKPENLESQPESEPEPEPEQESAPAKRTMKKTAPAKKTAKKKS